MHTSTHTYTSSHIYQYKHTSIHTHHVHTYTTEKQIDKHTNIQLQEKDNKPTSLVAQTPPLTTASTKRLSKEASHYLLPPTRSPPHSPSQPAEGGADGPRRAAEGVRGGEQRRLEGIQPGVIAGQHEGRLGVRAAVLRPESVSGSGEERLIVGDSCFL